MESAESEERRKRDKALKVVLAPALGLYKFTGWLVDKAFGKKGKGEEFAEDVILSMVDAGSEGGFIEETSKDIIANAFEFDDLTASDVMTHRVNIFAVADDTSLEKLIYSALEEGFSRIPVYKENIDDVIGIIIVKDLLSLIGKTAEELNDFSTSDFLREAVFVPETCPCSKLFKILTDNKTGLAIVADEYGGTAGIVAMEDLVEEIMGSIRDEYDEEEDEEIKKIGNEKYSINGETDPEEALALFGYELPEGHEYDTTAGFVTDLLGFIPDFEKDGKPVNGKTPCADYKDVRFVAVGAEDNCISKIIAYRKK